MKVFFFNFFKQFLSFLKRSIFHPGPSLDPKITTMILDDPLWTINSFIWSLVLFLFDLILLFPKGFHVTLLQVFFVESCHETFFRSLFRYSVCQRLYRQTAFYNWFDFNVGSLAVPDSCIYDLWWVTRVYSLHLFLGRKHRKLSTLLNLPCCFPRSIS